MSRTNDKEEVQVARLKQFVGEMGLGSIGGAPPMPLGKPRRRDASDAAVWPHFVVVAPPGADRLARLPQRLEPVFIETFVAKLAVEAPDVPVLHGSPRFDQPMTHAVLLGPGHERPARELRLVVGTHRFGIAPEARRPIEQPRDSPEIP